MLTMTSVLREESLEVRIRKQAGLQIKVFLTSNNEVETLVKADIWRR